MRIALPGFEAKEVEVTAAPSDIVVHAATKQEKRGEKDNVLWTEFGSNDVYRRFELPNSIVADKVTANLENGLLRINAPEIAKPKATAKAA
jgi:HSP20 family protein